MQWLKEILSYQILYRLRWGPSKWKDATRVPQAVIKNLLQEGQNSQWLGRRYSTQTFFLDIFLNKCVLWDSQTKHVCPPRWFKYDPVYSCEQSNDDLSAFLSSPHKISYIMHLVAIIRANRKLVFGFESIMVHDCQSQKRDGKSKIIFFFFF